MSALKDFLRKKVHIVTTDARFFEGTLEGFDNSTNIVVSLCIERVIHPEENEENEEIPLGVYLIRGGNVVCIGEISDLELDWSKVKGLPLKGTKNPL